MLLASLRRRNTIVADLARVLVGWLVVILLVQGQAALLALVHGPAHRHVSLAPSSAEASHDLSRHAMSRLPSDWSTFAPKRSGIRLGSGPAAHVSHHEAHEQGRAHHHGPGELSLPADGEATLDAAACVLAGALAPLIVAYCWLPPHAVGAFNAAAAWAFLARTTSPPRKPPRA